MCLGIFKGVLVLSIMKTLFVVVGLLLCSEVSCVTWNQPGTPDDGAVVYACMGSDVSFLWNYTLEDTEDYSSIQWSNGNSKSVEDGAYTCRVPQQHLAAACLHSNRTDEDQAKVIVDKVEVKIALMEVELTSLKKRVEDTASTPLIAFNVQAMEGQQLTSPSRVQFHTVLYNQGEGFHNETGVFTAPLTGSYFFLFHTRSQGDHLADSALMAHNVPVCVTYIYAGFQQGSCHAVVHLQKDGQVWVEPYKYKGYYAADTTSFSGFLLKSYA